MSIFTKWSGIAHSAGGGDGGDTWYLANNTMYKYLQQKLALLANIKKEKSKGRKSKGINMSLKCESKM